MFLAFFNGFKLFLEILVPKILSYPRAASQEILEKLYFLRTTIKRAHPL
jgi:hypothetical protein